jgi:hypothetical protein
VRWKSLVVSVAVALATLGAAVPAHADPAGDAEARFVAKINALRAEKGVQPLVVDAELTGIGRRWAAHMAEAGQISHNPDYAAQVHQDWGKLGENVGMGPDVDTLFDAFVRSAGHYRNLVDPDFNRIGVGVVIAPDGTMFTAHQFMMLRGSSTKAAPVPAPTPTAAPRPAPAPRPAVAPEPRPSPAPAAAPAPPPVAAPPPAPAAPARLVSMLAVLRALDARAA